MEEIMSSNIDRRSALALGMTVAATSLIASSAPAAAKTYGPDEGKELFPGVRAVELGKRDSNISAYKTVDMLDVVFQPGANFPVGEAMEHDMVCQVTTGELQIKAGEKEFAAKDGDVWSCGKGSTKEGATNKGKEVAVMRVIYLKV
jgi:redox-sensitive bicupin YhaK (pirin superfamily)